MGQKYTPLDRLGQAIHVLSEVSVRVAKPIDADTLAQEQVAAASKEKVLEALGEAASKPRGELGESLGTVEKFNAPLEQATTSSLEALKAYSLGLRSSASQGVANLGSSSMARW